MDDFDSNDADDWFDRNKNKLTNHYDIIDRQLLSIFSQYISSTSKFLEIGCGDGSRASKIAKEFKCTVSGIDLSTKGITRGKKRYKNIQLDQGDARSLPFDSKTFDFVYLGFFLYLINRDFYLKVLSEADRMVKDDGYLAILDFDVPTTYSNNYVHRPTMKSFKMDNSKVFSASGLYTLVAKSTFQHNSDKPGIDVDQRVSVQILQKENSF